MAELKKPELKLKYLNRFELPYKKIVSPTQAIAKSLIWQKQGQKVVVIDVVSDIVQMLHYEYYLACANLGDRLIVRVVENTSKDPRGSIIPFDQRTHTLAHIPYVDLICGMKEGEGLKWIEQFRPSIIVKSTTSGVKVVKEIQEVNDLDYIPEIVIMGDRCDIIPLDQAEEKGLEYENTKFRGDRVSGSVHKQTIINRHIEDNQANLQCDLPCNLPCNLPNAL